MSRKNSGISWIKKAEPKFIREFKERIAYKEQASVETKKKKLGSDLIVEKEEDRPQIVQLKSGDLGEKEYKELKDKEEIQNAGSSFGKILFKKPNKNKQEATNDDEQKLTDNQSEIIKKKTEIDLIFNLNEKGEEIEEAESETTSDQVSEEVVLKKKKIYLDNEEETKELKYGLQEPVTKKKRFIDGPTSKITNLSASKVLEREAKTGNKKLLSFYDQEQDELEDYYQEDFKEKLNKQQEKEDENSN